MKITTRPQSLRYPFIGYGRQSAWLSFYTQQELAEREVKATGECIVFIGNGAYLRIMATCDRSVTISGGLGPVEHVAGR